LQMLLNSQIPLSERIRPYQLDEVIGQEHLVGKTGILRKAIEKNILPSVILWGQPGTGKTTLANVIANQMKRPFYTLNAINAGVKDVREAIEQAKRQTGTILFIDEIHRFNKTQQDALLYAIEKGTITLIGATTENPSFELNAALLSRCQVYTLKALSRENLMAILHQAITKDSQLSQLSITVTESEALLNFADGDARKLLNLLELVVQNSTETPINITDEQVIAAAQQKTILYDKTGENHYDIISAFIKSIRGSDPNAAVYWLARMLEGGEDVKFIARRMLILASEDIGNANPNALLLATNCFQAVSIIGMPEARIILSQTATYLAASVKSNAAYLAINQAQALVQQTGNLPTPLHLRNAPTALMKQQGYGAKYMYSHNYENHFVPQEYLPEAIAGTKLYDPADNPRENELRNQLKKLWKDKYGY
jgi:putative ATPase